VNVQVGLLQLPLAGVDSSGYSLPQNLQAWAARIATLQLMLMALPPLAFLAYLAKVRCVTTGITGSQNNILSRPDAVRRCH